MTGHDIIDEYWFTCKLDAALFGCSTNCDYAIFQMLVESFADFYEEY